MKTPITVGQVAALLEDLYPLARAEDWDVVGLTVGLREAPVTRLHYAVEPTMAVVEEAVAAGADLLITHHPLLLRGINRIDLDTAPGMIISTLLQHGIALYVAHTNADVSAHGTVDALAAAVGLRDARPLTEVPEHQLDKIISFVPDDHLATVTAALATAGAGAIGDYDQCRFVSPGIGSFRPLAGSAPYVGQVGEIEEVNETRLEMIMPRSRRRACVEALLAIHPYETPAYDVFELAAVPSPIGLGRVGNLSKPTRLADFAQLLAERLPATATGIRVGGDLDRRITIVAVQAGSGDSLLSDAHRSGADVYVTSDLRHHPASDALARPGAPALIDIPHWAAEWLWLPDVERVLGERLTAAGTPLPSSVSTLCTDPWTLSLPGAQSAPQGS